MPESRTFTQYVDDLAVEHRAKVARRALIVAGADALPAVRAGLRHPDVRVVAGCIAVIDRVADDATLQDLFDVLEHPDSSVRARALHALSCEHCKQDDCRPDQGMVRAAMLAACDDPDPGVRHMAVEALSAIVHDWDDALEALVRLAASDRDGGVRKKAALAVPGGPIYEGRRSKSGRLRRRPPLEVHRRAPSTAAPSRP